MTEYERPIVTVDLVLLALREGTLHTALLERDREPAQGTWTLPGGWVHTDKDEDALDSAARILKTKTGLTSPYFEQLGTFTGRHRDSRGWSISIAYYALVPSESIAWVRATDKLRWRAVDEVRSLPFDHLQILRTAVSRVRSKSLYSSLPLHLMPERFSLSELQTVYEQLLGAKLDKRAFRRRIEELDVLEKAPGHKPSEVGVAHRPAQHYRLKVRGNLVLAQKNLGVR